MPILACSAAALALIATTVTVCLFMWDTSAMPMAEAGRVRESAMSMLLGIAVPLWGGTGVIVAAALINSRFYRQELMDTHVQPTTSPAAARISGEPRCLPSDRVILSRSR
jgi:hypothetical protein